MKHKCTTCAKELPTCDGNGIVWGIDREPHVTGAEVDRVLECDAYTRKKRRTWFPLKYLWQSALTLAIWVVCAVVLLPIGFLLILLASMGRGFVAGCHAFAANVRRMTREMLPPKHDKQQRSIRGQELVNYHPRYSLDDVRAKSPTPKTYAWKLVAPPPDFIHYHDAEFCVACTSDDPHGRIAPMAWVYRHVTGEVVMHVPAYASLSIAVAQYVQCVMLDYAQIEKAYYVQLVKQTSTR